MLSKGSSDDPLFDTNEWISRLDEWRQLFCHKLFCTCTNQKVVTRARQFAWLSLHFCGAMFRCKYNLCLYLREKRNRTSKSHGKQSEKTQTNGCFLSVFSWHAIEYNCEFMFIRALCKQICDHFMLTCNWAEQPIYDSPRWVFGNSVEKCSSLYFMLQVAEHLKYFLFLGHGQLTSIVCSSSCDICSHLSVHASTAFSARYGSSQTFSIEGEFTSLHFFQWGPMAFVRALQ